MWFGLNEIARVFTYLELMGLFESASSEFSLGTQFIREFCIILHQKPYVFSHG